MFLKYAHLMHQRSIDRYTIIFTSFIISFIQAYKLWFIALKLPLIIIITIGAIFPLVISMPKNNPLVNIHHGTCTILVAIGLSEFICNTAKVYVGRLRPNFYAMCGFDKETLECTADSHQQAESRMSFPSGHSSVSFTGLVCVTLFLLGRVGLNRNVGTIRSSARGKTLLLISCMPLLLAFYCAVSRLADNWHHPSDIIAGTALGTICAGISYHLYFP
jgi:diacylglycerol diphosphate phosphatase / phosphatidate phosphatase